MNEQKLNTVKKTNKKQAKQIEAIIYQVRSKIYCTRKNEFQVNYNEPRIKLHLMNINNNE